MKMLSVRQLLVILMGGAISPSILLIGQMLYQDYGFFPACVASLLGNLLLGGLAVFVAILSVKRRMTTVENARFAFGEKGEPLFGGAFLLCLLGWLAIQIHIMGTLASSLTTFSPLLFDLLFGSILTLFSLFGIGGMKRLSTILLPILIGTLSIALLRAGGIHPESAHFSLKGLSLVLAAAIGAVVDIPTYFRHARSIKDGVIASIILFCVVLPLVEGTGIYLSCAGSDIFSGKGAWGVLISFFLFASTWSAAMMNLYSATVNSIFLLPKLSFSLRNVLMGTVGTLLAIYSLPLETLLNVIGVFIGSGGCLIPVTLILKQRLSQKTSLLLWGSGILLGLSCIFGFGLTSIPLLDACFGSIVPAVIFSFLKKRKGVFE